MREYMRRYLADPEKRAVHAARLRASAARRSAMDGRSRTGSVQCVQCGAKFAADGSRVRYCSNPCRKEGRARTREAYMRRLRAAAEANAKAARCRACSKEFAPGNRGGRLMFYCSAACRAEWRRGYYREYERRRQRRPRR